MISASSSCLVQRQSLHRKQSLHRSCWLIPPQGWALTPLGHNARFVVATLKELRRSSFSVTTTQPFQGCDYTERDLIPRVAKAQPWAEIGQHLRCKQRTYRF